MLDNYIGIYNLKKKEYDFISWKQVNVYDMVNIANNNNSQSLYCYTSGARLNILMYFIDNQFFSEEQLSDGYYEITLSSYKSSSSPSPIFRCSRF